MDRKNRNGRNQQRKKYNMKRFDTINVEFIDTIEYLNKFRELLKQNDISSGSTLVLNKKLFLELVYDGDIDIKVDEAKQKLVMYGYTNKPIMYHIAAYLD